MIPPRRAAKAAMVLASAVLLAATSGVRGPLVSAPTGPPPATEFQSPIPPSPTLPPPSAGTPPPAEPPTVEPAVQRYGSSVDADTLANTQVGGRNYSPASRTSLRFRAGVTGALEAIRIYLEDGRGYSAGDGGVMEVTIQTDDGSEAHRPSGAVLATETFRPGNPITDRLGERRFSEPASLTSGQLYHVVFRNIARRPGEDFVSVNALFISGDRPGLPGPGRISNDWALLIDTGTGFRVRTGYTPILQLRYANGVVEGQGYIEAWSHPTQRISGTWAVREAFTPKGAPRSVRSVAVRADRSRGAGPLTVRLERMSGEVLGSVVMRDVPADGPAWFIAQFADPVPLEAGTTYHLVLTAPADTVYDIIALRKGTVYGFSGATYFDDGHAEYTDGSVWRGFDQPGGTQDTREADLQFYLE